MKENKLGDVLFRLRWRLKNRHNHTHALSRFDPGQVTVGRETYGGLDLNLGTNPARRVEIGHYCSIGPGVKFIVNPHNYRFFSTWPFQVFAYGERWYGWEEKTSILVEDDVWIGAEAVILGGAVLRQGCVVGAGAVVTGEVPPYAIYAGQKVLKYRFSPEVCRRLARVDYARLDPARLETLRGWHRVEIGEGNIEELMALLPQKETEKEENQP